MKLFMDTGTGNPAKEQVVYTGYNGLYLFSYGKPVAYRPYDGEICCRDKNGNWDTSETTRRYVRAFTGVEDIRSLPFFDIDKDETKELREGAHKGSEAYGNDA